MSDVEHTRGHPDRQIHLQTSGQSADNSTDQTYNIIVWQTLFTWLWRWLPLGLSKRNHQQQFFSVLSSPGRSHYRVTIRSTNVELFINRLLVAVMSQKSGRSRIYGGFCMCWRIKRKNFEFTVFCVDYISRWASTSHGKCSWPIRVSVRTNLYRNIYLTYRATR